MKVLDLQGNPVENVEIGTEGPGGSSKTTSNGIARIPLVTAVIPGSWVTLQLLDNRYAFISPWDRRVLVPSPENATENYVPIRIVRAGDRKALENNDVLTTLAARFKTTLPVEDNGIRLSDSQRKTVLSQIARDYGFKPQDIDKALREWPQKTNDPLEKALAAIYADDDQEALKNLLNLRSSEEGASNGSQEPLTRFTRAFFLGQIFFGMGKYQEAITNFKQCIAVRGNAPYILNQLSLALIRSGNFQEAVFYLEQVIAAKEEISDSKERADRVQYPNALEHLAYIYKEAGDFKTSEHLYKESLEIKELTFQGRENIHVLIALNGISQVYIKWAQYDEAEKYLREALKYINNAKPQNIEVGNTLEGLAQTYFGKGDLTKAEYYYKRAVEVFTAIAGPDHPETGTALNNLGVLYQRQGKYTECEPIFKKVLTIKEARLGPNHLDVAVALGNLGGIYSKDSGKYSDAEAYLKRALNIVEMNQEPDHAQVASILNNIGYLYLVMDRYRDAQTVLERALKIDQKLFGYDHPSLIEGLINLGWANAYQDEYREANSYFERALELAKQGNSTYTYEDVFKVHQNFQKTHAESLAQNRYIGLFVTSLIAFAIVIFSYVLFRHRQKLKDAKRYIRLSISAKKQKISKNRRKRMR